MTKQEAFKFLSIKRIYTKGKNKQILDKLLSVGFRYAVLNCEKHYYNAPFLYIREDGTITHGNDITTFKNHKYEEISESDVLNMDINTLSVQPMRLPKTWEEFCKTYKSTYVLPSKYAAEQHLALMQLHQLRDCYRQGWIPDWDDEKFIITVNYKEFYSVGKCIKTKEFLAFQSREIAEEFLTNFRDLIEQAGDLI